MKSKGVAFLLCLFGGWLGLHRFYLGSIGMGILYLLTGGLCCIGWFIDLFTVGTKVDVYNALHFGLHGGGVQAQAVNVQVTNAPQPAQTEKSSNLEELEKLHEMKEKGIITEEEFQQRKAKLL